MKEADLQVEIHSASIPEQWNCVRRLRKECPWGVRVESYAGIFVFSNYFVLPSINRSFNTTISCWVFFSIRYASRWFKSKFVLLSNSKVGGNRTAKKPPFKVNTLKTNYSHLNARRTTFRTCYLHFGHGWRKVYLIPIANLLLCTNSRSNVQRSNIPTTPVKTVSKFIENVGKLYLKRVKIFSTKPYSLVNKLLLAAFQISHALLGCNVKYPITIAMHSDKDST